MRFCVVNNALGGTSSYSDVLPYGRKSATNWGWLIVVLFADVVWWGGIHELSC
jgi:hypothetical protein